MGYGSVVRILGVQTCSNFYKRNHLKSALGLLLSLIVAIVILQPALMAEAQGSATDTPAPVPNTQPQSLDRMAAFGLYKQAIKGDTTALKTLRATAEAGNAFSQQHLGSFYYCTTDHSPCKADYAQAIYWYRKAADRGDRNGQFMLGMMYQSGQGVRQDNAQAVEWYRKAAEQGQSAAQSKLAEMYEQGIGVRRNKEEARKWREASARTRADNLKSSLSRVEGGDAKAQESLCLLATEPDQKFQWCRKAAEQGNALSQTELGWMYASGTGVSKDYAQALEWYRKAAEQDNGSAEWRLSTMYAKGLGVPQDSAQAGYWLQRAADHGNKIAIEELEKAKQQESQEPKEKGPSVLAGVLGAIAGGVSQASNVPGSSPGMSKAASLAGMYQAAQNNDLQGFVQAGTAPYTSASPGTQAVASGMNAAAAVAQPGSVQNLQPDGSPDAISQALSQQMSNMNAALTQAQTAQQQAGASGSCGACVNAGASDQAQCRNNFGAQAPCYRAVAAMCQCALANGGCGMAFADLQKCVADNTRYANNLNSTAPTIAPSGQTQPRTTPTPPKTQPSNTKQGCSDGHGGFLPYDPKAPACPAY